MKIGLYDFSTVTRKEYEAAKLEIIGGVKWYETTLSPNQYGMNSKQYSTDENGTFMEVTDPRTGLTEFWSTKHSESRYYDGECREELIARYEKMFASLIKENQKLLLDKKAIQWRLEIADKNNASLAKINIELKEKLAAIKAMTEATA